MVFFRVILRKRRSVVFRSFTGKSYSDNPRAISEALHDLDPSVEIVWLFKDPIRKKRIVPEYVKCVKHASLAGLKELARSAVWVDNFGKQRWIFKSKRQYYIQTWHGDRGFKKILYDLPEHSRDNRVVESRMCDLIVTGSTFGEKLYRTAMNYTGSYLPVGCPRNDVLLNPCIQTQRMVRDTYDLEGKHFLLYAPTFRRASLSSGRVQKIQDLDLLQVLEHLEDRTGTPWICGVRGHSASGGLSDFPITDKIVDLSDYEDMADLLQVTDLLLTDYSSSATDFILTDKPVILYQSDYDEYVARYRELYHAMEETGFLVARSQEELVKYVDEIPLKKCDHSHIREFYGLYETGNAAQRTARTIVRELEARGFGGISSNRG